MSKQKIWELIEAYRTSGGSEEHHARKELLDAAIDKALARRTWVGLTNREKSNLWLESRAAIPRFHTYVTLVEAKLKEKNT